MNKLAVWAIDPFESGVRPGSAVELEDWLQIHHFFTRPVYVQSESEDKKHPAERVIGQYLKRLGIKRKKVTILLERMASKANPTQRIEEFADKVGAPFIILSTHGRPMAPRLLLGSFAENLLSKSERPIMFLPKDKLSKSSSLDRILFATDFSSHSRKALHHLLPLAKILKSELIIYHVLSLPNTAAYSIGMGTAAPIAPENYFAEQEHWARAMGRRWAKLSVKYGVSARFIVTDEVVTTNIAELILNAAQVEKAGLIATASASRNIASFFIGSVASGLIRENKIPLLVYGPECIRTKAKAARWESDFAIEPELLEHSLWDKNTRAS